MEASPVKVDPLLEPLLSESAGAMADDVLLQLINAHAEPVIKSVIRYKLRLSSSNASQQAEADDIRQDALVQLLAQLREFRKVPDERPISDFRGIAATIAHRTCYRWMRRQFPERHAQLHEIFRAADKSVCRIWLAQFSIARARRSNSTNW